MQAGDLRERITIQARLESTGTTGEVTWTWIDYLTVWGAVEPLRGEEYFAARQLQAATSLRIRIRWQDGITTKMRVAHRGRYYEIEAVLHIGSRRREAHLMCREREADGWRD